MIDTFKKLPSILARWIPCTDYLRTWTYNFQRGRLTFTGLGQLLPAPETEDHILPVPTAVRFISENIFIVCLWLILSAFSSNHCSPPNPGYRRLLILVISICKLRSRFLDHRSLCQDHSLNWMGPLKLLVLHLAFQLTELGCLWGME